MHAAPGFKQQIGFGLLIFARRARRRSAFPFRSASGVLCGCGRSRRTPAVTRLSALSACLSRKTRILRETALFVRHALTAFTAGLRSKLTVLREATFFAGYALAAFTAGLGSELAILREAAF